MNWLMYRMKKQTKQTNSVQAGKKTRNLEHLRLKIKLLLYTKLFEIEF